MAKCPTCKRPIPADADNAPTPFCSQRCKLADLHGWLNGSYVVSEPLGFDESLGLAPNDDDYEEPRGPR